MPDGFKAAAGGFWCAACWLSGSGPDARSGWVVPASELGANYDVRELTADRVNLSAQHPQDAARV
jgi:hypothetical protein